MTKKVFLGIDVGTGSARCGVFDASGALLGVAKREIQIWQDAGGIAEHSSKDIWKAVCEAVAEAINNAYVAPADVAGIGFDATCSLVLVRENGEVPAGPSGVNERDVIVWMDHRAVQEAEEINTGDHDVLRYVGGRISPEMQTPKLLWLKRHLPESYHATDHFMDLSDWLTYRATGDTARSSCTVTCKWTYLAHEDRWDSGYFNGIGLEDLAADHFARIGTRIVAPGTALGRGLTEAAAADMGLVAGTPVAAALIDAHAGGVGSVGGSGGPGQIATRMGYVFGTSACTMSSAPEPNFVPGVWGPYYSAMVPGLWLNEGGQSAAGAALDRLISGHAAFFEAEERARECGQGPISWLTALALNDLIDPSEAIARAGSTIVVPDFNGNRAPLADPSARGIVAGLGMEDGLDGLVQLFIAGLSGIAMGLKHILDVQRENGVAIEAIVISGGAGENPLGRQMIADATELPVLLPDTAEPVLLGAAILGATAAGVVPDVSAGMAAMSRIGAVIEPGPERIRILHRQRYARYLALQNAMRPDGI